MNYQSNSNPFARYAAGGSGRRFGDLIRHNGRDGGWCTGINNDVVELGAHFVVVYTETCVGFTKWVDTEPDQVVVSLRSNPDLRALRESLGDLDPSLWTERTAKGKPRDPWRPSVLLPFVKPETREAFTFSTSSSGGEQAARRLIGDCDREARMLPEETKGRLPLVEIGETSYQHSDRRLGVLYNPVFMVVDWVPTATIAETLQRLGLEVPVIEHKPKMTQLGVVPKQAGHETIHEIVEDDAEAGPVKQQPSKPAKRKLPSWKDLSDDEPDVRAGAYDNDD